ncbi:MAG TPA: IS66 family transposase [Candidatus Binatia bacterium]|nr:IS66 family transposase [Candidatus Binatia bacterium]
MKASAQPIDVNTEELKLLVERAREAPLEEAGCRKLHALIDTFEYVTLLLEDKQTTIQALRQLLLKPSTEKTEKILQKAGVAASEKPSKPPGTKTPKKAKGHGRNSAESYKAAPKIKISHPLLKPGDYCPKCQEGKVYAQREPGLLVRIAGQAPLAATVYELERLRCNLCGDVFTAEAPERVGTKKYDETSASMIALLKYGSGFPFYRLEGLQENLEIPLPAATQWEIVAAAAALIQPAMDELIRQAAQGKVLHNDDTSMKVLGLMKELASTKGDSSDAPERTGVFTSGIVSTRDGQKIALFFTGRKHAGENLSTVLARRAAALGPPIQMCDALSRNLPKPLQVILGYCLTHGRRRFVEVAPNFPSECRYVLEALGEIYHYEELVREQGMTPEERLRFHQAHSGPVMEALQGWLTEQLEGKKVEPNSGLGQAITYMRKHWEKLTLFLRQAGAPLDNNLCERALKKAILHRKNSLFYKTRKGARVGDLFMSLVHTAELCGTNPFDYLTELQRHAADLQQNPQEWMPWNYRQTLVGTGATGLAA